MSKYIIEIEDVPFSKVRIDADGAQNINLYRAKGFNALVFDKHGLDKLTPLDKALNNELEEAYHKGFEAGSHEATTLEYQQGLDEAWECAKRIALVKTDKDCPYFTVTELEKIFGCSTYQSVFDTYSASEAIEKIKVYEERQKSDEIKVGDEVKNTLELMNNAVGYFIEPTNNEHYRVLRYVNGKINIVAWRKENCVRTGKHSYAVERMYVVLKGEQSCSSCEYSNDPDGVKCRDCCGYDKWEPKEVRNEYRR